ncbi:transposase [Poriferisphaera sp. WC338]|uniref:transposase n=1 Tax=Poriferisphaera sp. WC338 TaxID=3425129 RepID=UPI003D8153B3
MDMNSEAAKDWYHVIFGTYGSWLPGDPRGFRTRGHKLHCEGDYKNRPAAGQFESLHEYSQSLMVREAVRLTLPQRKCVCSALAESLKHYGITVNEIAVAKQHMHLLAQFEMNDKQYKPQIMTLIGKCKRWAITKLKEQHLCDESSGKLWAKSGKVICMKNERHFKNTSQYIMNHIREGAAVYSLMAGESES